MFFEVAKSTTMCPWTCKCYLDGFWFSFRSLVSERNITAPCTLRDDRIPNHFNIKQNPDGDKKKWRYSLWDMDATFGHYVNYTGIPETGPEALYISPSVRDVETYSLTQLWSDGKKFLCLKVKFLK